MDTAVRFWTKVAKADGDACWLWTGAHIPNGYGSFSRTGRRAGAHRVAWELTNGPIQPGMQVLHRCDVKGCVRPSHLFIGTQRDNMHDRNDKGRAHIPSGGSHHWARFDDAVIDAVRADHASGMSIAEAGRRNGVSRPHASRIVHGQTRG